MKTLFRVSLGPEKYGMWPAYSTSKLGNMLFTYELHRRLQQGLLLPPIARKQSRNDESQAMISVCAVTPGITNTELSRHSSGWLLWLSAPLRAVLLKSSVQGGEEIVFAAAVKSLPSVAQRGEAEVDVHKKQPGHSQQAPGSIAVGSMSGRFFGEHRELKSSLASKHPVLGKVMWDMTEVLVEQMLKDSQQKR